MTKNFVMMTAVLALSGCATAERFNQTAETVIDAVAKQAELVSDKAMTGLDRALVLLDHKKQRLRSSRCKMPFTALRRYAQRGKSESETVERDCRLVIEPSKSRALAD